MNSSGKIFIIGLYNTLRLWNSRFPMIALKYLFTVTLKHSWFQFFLQVSVWELHNRMVSPLDEGRLRETRDSDNNIIISDSMLRTILPPQLKKLPSQYKVMCGYECCISAKCMHSSLLSWSDNYLNKIKYLSKNTQDIFTVFLPYFRICKH